MVNRLWGKIPNVIEQRLLVALYQVEQPMTDSQILSMAKTLGLLNVTMNLLALDDKGLIIRNASGQYTLTPGGRALTEVGVAHNLFATPKELSDLVKQPSPPGSVGNPIVMSLARGRRKWPRIEESKDPTPPPPVSPTPSHSTEETAAGRLWERETTRDASSRLAESPRLAAALGQPRGEPSSCPTPPIDPSGTPLVRALTTSPVTPAPLLVLPRPAVVERAKPKSLAAPLRRPPPPPKFRK